MQVINRKARFDYEVIETFEAGVVLTGAEVKSIKKGQVNLMGSRVIFEPDGTYVLGMSVAAYEYANDEDYDPERKKKLLLSARQIEYLASKKESAGLTIVGLRVYNRGSLIKVEIGLVRGKKRYEKREKIKKRTEERKIARLLN